MVLDGHFAAMVLTEQCNAMFCLQQLYAAAAMKVENFEIVYLDILQDLVCESLKHDQVAHEARTALGLYKRTCLVTIF
jgi:hypothetical protein